MGLAALGAMAIGQFQEAALLDSDIGWGSFSEDYAEAKSKKEMTSLFSHTTQRSTPFGGKIAQ